MIDDSELRLGRMAGAPALVVVALEAWFSSSRLPRFLQAAGFKIIVVCTPASPLVHVDGIEERIVIERDAIAAALEAIALRHEPVLIVPADEDAMRALRGLLRRREAAAPSSALAGIVSRSLGRLALDDEAGSKRRVNEVAALLGIRVPSQALITNAVDAQAFARDVGYPIVLKKEDTFGGMGVVQCRDDIEVMVGWHRLQARTRAARLGARLLGRTASVVAPLRRYLSGYRGPPLLAQKFIPGGIGFRSFVANRGQVLAGVTAIALAHHPAPFGASSVVEFIDHEEVADATAALAQALDLSGFAGIDFIFHATTGEPYLIELNSRVTPIAHLGRRVGVDLCAALHAAMTEQPLPPLGPVRRMVVALFPNELNREPDSPWLRSAFHDVPWDDAVLLDAWRGKLPHGDLWRRQSPSDQPGMGG
jgi:biotin carboxylase